MRGLTSEFEHLEQAIVDALPSLLRRVILLLIGMVLMLAAMLLSGDVTWQELLK